MNAAGVAKCARRVRNDHSRRTAGIDPKHGVSTAPDALYYPVNPGHRRDLPWQAPGRMQVDFAERIDFRRMHNA
jgi:hypothetical protein